MIGLLPATTIFLATVPTDLRKAKYGHGLELVETFVDRSRFHGGAYAASNWLEVGLTQGRSRGDREHRIQVPKKAVDVYPLSGQVRQRLCR